MNITTKYAVGEILWFMFDNKPVHFPAIMISIEVTPRESEIHYKFQEGGRWHSIPQKDCFSSKIELLTSL